MGVRRSGNEAALAKHVFHGVALMPRDVLPRHTLCKIQESSLPRAEASTLELAVPAPFPGFPPDPSVWPCCHVRRSHEPIGPGPEAAGMFPTSYPSPAQRRLQFRLWQMNTAGLTVAATTWCATLGPI